MMNFWQTLLVACIPAIIGAIITIIVSSMQLNRSKTEIEEKYSFDKKLHISNNRFDMELSIHKEISEKLVSLIANINNLFPTGLYFEPPDKEQKAAYYNELYKVNETSYNETSKAINSYAIFIPKEIYEKYHIIRKECYDQIRSFHYVRIVNFEKSGYDKIYNECLKRTEKINNLYGEIIEDLRNYIKSLEQRR